ncbi:response regulator [Inquilinus limosus]|uniref:response regulator n=1 Tax=Inquilinus limosus TaxID=171674 RepID=UPI00068A9CF8|nr:response regulator [Inquilinus limosus]
MSTRTTDGPGGVGRRDRLIVVEDDPVTRSMIARYFADEGFDVEEAATGAECRRALKRTPADLLFIDIQLPDGDGFELAREIRSTSAVGIIFVTQKDSEVDRVVGLELAGDDYVTKPVKLRELLARSRALLRRRGLERDAARHSNTVITFESWLLDQTRRELTTRDGTPVRVTRGEFDLLAALVQANGRPLSRDYLVEVVSNRDTEVGDRTVDALVARLRRKLQAPAGGPPVIVTVTGVGYKLGVRTDARG